MTAPATPTSRGGSWRLWLMLVLAVVVTVLVLPDDPGPSDLDSTGTDGYKALRLELESFGATTKRIDANDITRASAGMFDTILVPTAAGATSAQRDRWRAFAATGGTLVLGQPAEAPTAAAATPSVLLRGIDHASSQQCTIPALRRSGELDIPPTVQPMAAVGREWCFGSSSQAFVVAHREGAGRVVTLASPDLWTNELLGMAPEDKKVAAAEDLPANGVIAQLLLAPAGRERIGVVTSGVAVTGASGGKSLSRVIPAGVKLGLGELVAAFLFYAWFRARRHGRLIREATPVTLAGSQLVDAVGNLRERRDDRQRVALELRRQARHDLARVLGLPVNASVAEVAAVVAERGVATVDELTRALGDDDVHSDAELMALSHSLDSIRREALHV